MSNMLFANNANTTLASSLTNVATTMSVTSATGFPSPTGSQYFYCTLADAATQTTIEIVKVTAVSGTTFTIVRGQDGTTGTAFSAGDVVSLRLVRASLNDFPKLDENNTFSYAPTFNTALAVGSGGTGVTASSGANSVVLRDSNQNVYANNFIPNTTTTVASSTPINLTVASAQYQVVTGTTTSQTFNLPDATTLSVGDTFYFNNNITYSAVQVYAHDGSTSILSLQAGGVAQVILLTNGTSNGTWDVHSYVPSSVSWGTATLSFNTSSSISGSVSWLGNTVGVAHGGTGLTSLTAGYIPYGNGTSAYSSSSAIQFNGTTLTLANDAIINGKTVGLGGGNVVSNTAFGLNALKLNSSGSLCTAVGDSALYSNSSGAYNNAFGTNDNFRGQTLYSNTTGAYNCAFGNGALYSNQTGNSNVAMGTSALGATILGGNSAFGHQAGSATTGYNNGFFGYQSGSAVTTGYYNVILGSYTGSAAPISATGSNYVVLSDGQGNIKLTCFPTGGVSIGNTTDPGATNLSVTGNVNGASGYFGSIVQVATNLTNGTKVNINSTDTVPATSGSTQNGGLRVASKNTGTGGYVLDIGVSDTNAYAWLQMSNSAILNGAYAHEIALNPLGGNVLIGTTTNRSGTNSLVMGGLIFPQQATTAAAPAYVQGAIYFDTTLNKLRVGGATAWETITSV
jgi:hypothetical protein